MNENNNIGNAGSEDPDKVSGELSEDLIDRFEFERLLSELAATSVAPPVDGLGSHIAAWLSRIAQYFQLDYATIFEQRTKHKAVSVLESWMKPDLNVPPLDDISKAYPTMTARILKGEVIAFSDSRELPDDRTADVNTLKERSIKSLVCVPLSVGGSVIGALSCGMIRMPRQWTNLEINRIGRLAHVFANPFVQNPGNVGREKGPTK